MARFNTYCRKQHKDGRVCSLYMGHYGNHKENHLKSEWSDEECVDE